MSEFLTDKLIQEPNNQIFVPLRYKTSVHGLEYSTFQVPKAIVIRMHDLQPKDYWKIWEQNNNLNKQSKEPDQKPSKILSLQAQSLIKNLEPLGISRQDILLFTIKNSYWERSVDFYWPEKEEWQKFPLFVEPKYLIPWDCSGIADLFEYPKHRDIQSEGYTNTPLQKAMVEIAYQKAEVIIIDHPCLDSWMLADLSNLLSTRTDQPLVLQFDGKSLRPINPEDILAASEQWKPTEWFVYNYMLNARAIMGKIWFRAIQETETTKKESKEYWTKYLAGLEHLISYAFHPLSLQILYHIRKFPGEWTKTKKIGTDYDKNKIQLLVNSKMAEDISENLYQMVWYGSGKEHSWKSQPLDRVTSLTMQEAFGGVRLDKEGARSRRGYEVFITTYLKPLLWQGENTFVLTNIGKCFLKYLGDEFCDPDMFLRWREGECLVGKRWETQAKDWLDNFFSQMKIIADKNQAYEWNDFLSQKEWNKAGTAIVEENKKNLGLVGVWGKILPFCPENLTQKDYPIKQAFDGIRGESNLQAIRDQNNLWIIYAGQIVDISNTDEVNKIKSQASIKASQAPLEFLEYSKTSEFNLHLVQTPTGV